MTPIAATQKIEAAVVSPSVCPPSARQMMPTPRNPIPVATPATACPAVSGEHREREARDPCRSEGHDRERALARALAAMLAFDPDQEAEQRSESHPRRQRELERDAAVLEDPHGPQA